MANKTRLDQLLVELGYFPSCERARTSIMSNRVRIAGAPATKAGQQINIDKFYKELEINPDYLRVEELNSEYVSRGAYKLKAAALDFNLDFKNKVVLDIGASSGGFTDYSLQAGAKAVIAVDVGKAQLDAKLVGSLQVLNIESENFRHTNVTLIAKKYQECFNEPLRLDYMVADLSFISIIKILAKVKEFLASYGHEATRMVFLIKPQFEAEKQDVDKCAGVIRDSSLRAKTLDTTIRAIQAEGFEQLGLLESPIKGAKGNIEYLLYLRAI